MSRTQSVRRYEISMEGATVAVHLRDRHMRRLVVRVRPALPTLSPTGRHVWTDGSLSQALMLAILMDLLEGHYDSDAVDQVCDRYYKLAARQWIQSCDGDLVLIPTEGLLACCARQGASTLLHDPPHQTVSNN